MKDKKTMLRSAKTWWKVLWYDSNDLVSDPDIVLIILQNSSWFDALPYIRNSEKLKKDGVFMLEAVKLNWRCFEYADSDLKKRPRVCDRSHEEEQAGAPVGRSKIQVNTDRGVPDSRVFTTI
jgi:hypothetical protein